MSDDLRTVARDRARKVVGESVWDKLSETAQANAINVELRAMGAKGAEESSASSERVAAIVDGFKRLSDRQQTAAYIEIEEVWKGARQKGFH